MELNTLSRFHLRHIPAADLSQLHRDITAEFTRRGIVTAAGLRSGRIGDLGARYAGTNNKGELFAMNSSGLLAIPSLYERKHGTCSIYMRALIGQDWSHVFNGGDTDEKYYVYAHIDPTKSSFITDKRCGGNYGGMPFYIGKGTGNRAYDLKRNQGHGLKLRQLIEEGITESQIVNILFSNISEAKALEIEAKLIYFFGTVYSRATKKKGCLLNLDVPLVPDFDGVMKEPYSVKAGLVAAKINNKKQRLAASQARALSQGS